MINVPVRVLLYTLGPTALLLALTALFTGWHRRAGRCGTDLGNRVRTLGPFALLLVSVLLFNAYVRPRVDELSPAFAINLTDQLYLFEGHFVPTLQESVPQPLKLYFAATYVVGYAVLLIFPPLAYAVLDDLEHASALFVAYAANYLVGAIVYIAVVAFGPRNYFLRPVVEQPLYDNFPDVMYLTSAVNTNSNVFPSLHASMATTVLLLAYFTREEYPRWLAITAVLAPSVVAATMVLGIHWLADVLAGVAMAVVSVLFARWIVPRLRSSPDRPEHHTVERVRL